MNLLFLRRLLTFAGGLTLLYWSIHTQNTAGIAVLSLFTVVAFKRLLRGGRQLRD